MIIPELKATMGCEDESDCKATVEVRLALCLSGGFAFLPPDAPGWQMVVDPKRPSGPIKTLCQEHARKVSTAGAQVVTFREPH